MPKYFFVQACLFACGAFLIFSSSHLMAQEQLWTLQSSAQRLLDESPDRRAAEANVAILQGDLNQAGVWPNPSVNFGASNAMGKDDNAGGIDFNQISITQPLPLSGRLGLQRKQAGALLKQSEAEKNQQQLLLEREAARVFHGLQWSVAQYALAEQRLESANEFRRIGRIREQAGDLSRLERLRLDLVSESARQNVVSTKGKHAEALIDFQTVLNVTDINPQLIRLDSFPVSITLGEFMDKQRSHPMLIAAEQAVEAADFGVSVAKVNRFSDPELWLAQDRDVLDNRRQSSMAFGVSVTLPLWDRSKGNIAAARANKMKEQFNVEAIRRQLNNRLRRNYSHLEHLLEQGHKYQVNILEPAEEVFRLTRKGFVTGQVGILTLVDAVDTYYSAHLRYLELLKNAWLQVATLRQESGSTLFSQMPIPLNASEGKNQ